MDIIKLREQYLKNLENNIKQIPSNEELLFDDKKQNQSIFSEKETSIDDLIETISNKINNIDTIDDSLVEDIYLKLKNICVEHNKKINDWFDSKFDDDLNVLKNNFINYNNMNNLYLTKSFVIIEEKT
jgi:hypothetical protein